MFKTKIPTHIAVIMDGNRRWARQRRLPVIAGHKKVSDEILEPLIEHAADAGIKYLTFWAWSTENWGRDTKEISAIMRLFRKIINDNWERLHKKGVRIRVIGDIKKFDQDIQDSLHQVIKKTEKNNRITVIFALNYGGRDEIVRSVNKIITEFKNYVTIEKFNEYLDTSGIPDPEMIIRTGGEKRLSGFYLWQSEYSELFFPEWKMPEFTPQKLDDLINEYTLRSRRFGC